MGPDRIVLLVIDGGGIGAAPDAAAYLDEGSNTLGHALPESPSEWLLPHLLSLGLGELLGRPSSDLRGAYARLLPRAAGKDTISGHWEMMGAVTLTPFRTFPQGFPPELIHRFEKAIGRPVLGNRPASGTAIIEELGEEHLRTGHPIVYTSADSVFQIAAHEEVVPLALLYEWCAKARDLLQGEYLVGRVIARPFVGSPGSFQRTAERRDFSVPPPGPTVLDLCRRGGQPVVGVGKIGDIFAHRGMDREIHTDGDAEGLLVTAELLGAGQAGLIFVNLVDFDTRFGHRRDPVGYRQNLRLLDRGLGTILSRLGPSDLLLITADHGCDPTFQGSDHTREAAPLLAYGAMVRPGNLGVRRSFADIGATICEAWNLAPPSNGDSLWGLLTVGLPGEVGPGGDRV